MSFVSGCVRSERSIAPALRAAYRRRLADERPVIVHGAAPTVIEACTDDPAQAEHSPGCLTYRYFDHYGRTGRGKGKNKVTLRAQDHRFEFDAFP